MKISICREGVEIGEWTEEEVRSLYQQGNLLRNDFYWKEGATEWQSLEKFIKPPLPIPRPQNQESSTGLNRLAFLSGVFIAFLVALLVGALLSAMGAPTDVQSWLVTAILCTSFGGLAAYRMMNIGYPAWYCVFCFLPALNIAMFIICTLAPPGYARKNSIKQVSSR